MMQDARCMMQDARGMMQDARGFDVKLAMYCEQASVRYTQAVRRKSEAATEARRGCGSEQLVCQTIL